MNLSKKQQNFVKRYIETGNASQSYKDSYDVDLKRPYNSIARDACILLKNPKVSQVIKKAKKELEDTFFEDIRITKKYITEGILKNIKGAEAKFDYAVSLKGYAMLAQLYDLNDDKKNDRMIINEKENIALLENLKKRIVDVTPDSPKPC